MRLTLSVARVAGPTAGVAAFLQKRQPSLAGAGAAPGFPEGAAMSEQLPATSAVPSGHPIRLVVTDDLQRSRLTVFFRIILVIPHLIWLSLWGIAVAFAVFVAWIVGIFAGRIPDGLHGFIAGYIRYATHVYAYFSIAADPYPTFSGAAGYPIDVEIAPAAAQSRLTIFFRLLLAIPALIVLYLLAIVARIVSIIAWFYAVFAGDLNRSLRDMLAYWLRYNAQVSAYACLLTQRYPSFSDD
jgi:hypothetical protein